MCYIFSFIEKAGSATRPPILPDVPRCTRKKKQVENIVEKLCQRFRVSEEPRQWRNNAFCLTLLPFKSECSFKKLIEGLPFYRNSDKLHEQAVFNHFVEILTKARSNKANKPDTELNEFESVGVRLFVFVRVNGSSFVVSRARPCKS